VLEDWRDRERLRHVFEGTRVVRKPVRGIIAGYHVLPYVLVGPQPDQPARSVEVRGRIKVSPRFVIRPTAEGLTYGEVFAERELMDGDLVARLFSFRYAPRLTVESEDLSIHRRDAGPGQTLDTVLDELARREVIDTGVVVSPDVRLYPVSLDRFIREILDQEFS
jgi:hypothetical protein